MSEVISHSEEEDVLERFESRFGDEAATLEQLADGEVRLLGSIDQIYPDIIAKHKNIAELAEIDLELNNGHIPINRNETVLISDSTHEPIMAVFKPLSGENPEMQNEFRHKFYSRENIAFLVSRHFYFDLVPPTVIREINGEVGSLQLFMPPPDFLPARKIIDDLPDDDYDKITESNEVRKLLLLDHILANPDRHHDNYLFGVKDGEKKLAVTGREPTIIAIDHGMSLDERYYRLAKTFEMFHGPYQFLTTDNMTGRSRDTQIGPELLAHLENGLMHRDLLDNYLRQVPDIEHDELDLMWKRVEELVEREVFISPLNWKEVRAKK